MFIRAVTVEAQLQHCPSTFIHLLTYLKKLKQKTRNEISIFKKTYDFINNCRMQKQPPMILIFTYYISRGNFRRKDY